jgi:hypothetical protein
MLYYAWSLHTCIHMSKMIYCIMKTSIAHSFMERHIFPTCSPVVYPWFYADSRNRPCHGILHLALRPYHRFHSKFSWRHNYYCSCSESADAKSHISNWLPSDARFNLVLVCGVTNAAPSTEGDGPSFWLDAYWYVPLWVLSCSICFRISPLLSHALIARLYT